MVSLSAFKQAIFRLLRAGFRLTPMSVATRDRLRQRFLSQHANWVPRPPRGVVVENGGQRRPWTHAGQPAIGYVPWRTIELPRPLPATLVAFYLPQFHPIAENDAWWGRGFTEWRNVARALPQFEGHAQPRLPGELGFYDLRLPEVMRRQMQLAREYGVGAFCTYFYWFAGKTLLEAPLQQWLDDPSLDLPICLCWANENWSRRWDGRADDVLISQRHSVEDDFAFIAHVARYLRDPRYLRVEGKPMLLVYRPGLLPEPAATAERWRRWCRDTGIGEIHLAYVQSFDRVDPSHIGFDAAVTFPPNNLTLEPITAAQRLLNPDYRGQLLDWRHLPDAARTMTEPTYRLYPGVTPGWDNEPRLSGSGRTFLHASPRGYRDWLVEAIAAASRRVPKSPMVFINAWNEWAEGAVLEPDARLGYAYLEATRAALRQIAGAHASIDSRPCAIMHVWYAEVLDDLALALQTSGLAWRVVVTTSPEREQAVRERIAKLSLAADVEIFENRGRDVLPFLHVANRLLDEGVDVALKLHTKRSVHRSNGEQWRAELLAGLLGPTRPARAIEAFGGDSTLGLIAAEGHLQRVGDFWGANRDNITYLCRRLGLKPEAAGQARFVAGSMYWVRLEALRPLLDAHLDTWEFGPEQGQIDGSMAHAVERIITLAAESAGYRTASFATLVGEPEPEGSYAYARKT